MSQGARVESIDAIAAFKFALVKFIEATSAALGDAESDVQRTLMWLEGEQQQYWTSQIRMRHDNLMKAQEALRQKKLFKDSTGNTPSAIEEIKAVAVCQKRLQEAEEKLAKTKQYAKRLHKEALLYKGQTQRFQTSVSSEMPAAVSHLGALINALEEYAAMNMAGPGGVAQQAAADFFESSGSSMSRGEGTPAQHKQYAQLRSRTPSAPARAIVPEGGKAPGTWVAGAVSDVHRVALTSLEYKETAPQATEKVIIANASADGEAIFLERVQGASPEDSGWYIGPVKPGLDNAPNALRVADLLAVRPDLTPVLALPPGFLVVIDAGGVAAVLNEKDEDVWTSAAKQAS